MQVPEQLWMDALHVITLVEGVHGRLPVAVPFDGDVPGLHHALEVIGIEVLGDRPQEVGQRFGVGIHREPDEPAPGFALDAGEPVGGRPLGEGVDVRDAPV